jgi:FkbM family methyltransferase
MSAQERWNKFWRRYKANLWEPETKALLEKVLVPGDLFVDIGAWIGPVSLWALELGASVIAIEPDPIALEELWRCVGNKAEIRAVAVAPESGVVHLAPQYEFGDSMTRVSDEGFEVQALTLPEILHDRVPKLAVMDVEGYELALLPTVAPYLAQLGATLMVALHTDLPDPEWFAGYGRIEMPASARDAQGRSLSMIAFP